MQVEFFGGKSNADQGFTALRAIKLYCQKMQHSLLITV